MFNRALQGKYAPGSAFKPVTLLAALAGASRPPTKFTTRRAVSRWAAQFSGTGPSRKDCHRPGPVDAVAAMERSVNDYFYTMGMRAGIQAIADTARQSRVWASSSGLDMCPVDVSGSVPDPAWKRSSIWKCGFRATRSTCPSAKGIWR